jgi:hypothetical protein
MLPSLESKIEAAIKAGSLSRHKVLLEEGEQNVRQLWLRRPDVTELLTSEKLDPRQRATVNAALKRFIVGGSFTVVTIDCTHKEVESLGDIRELKGYTPPFLELRFKPPKHDLRLFGRCVGKDLLILTSYGMKSLTEHTGEKPLSVREHHARCNAFFKMLGLDPKWVPSTMIESFSNAEFL